MSRPHIWLLVALVFALGQACSKDTPKNTTSAEIGPTGGTLRTDSGAKLEVPPGALERETTLTLRTLDPQTAISGLPPMIGRIAGGVELGPEGLTFAKPVTLTIPLAEPLQPGQKLMLFYYLEADPASTPVVPSRGGWRQLRNAGTVSADGRSASFQIEHFSILVIQMNFGADTLDILGDSVETLGENGLSVDFANYQKDFENRVAKIGDRHVYTIPDPYGYDCYEVVGLEYNLYHDLELLFENPLHNEKGEKGEVALFYNYEGDRITVVGDKERTFVYKLSIYVYINRVPPELSLSATRSSLKVGESTDVTGSLICGSDPMRRQRVTFLTSGLGSLSPQQVETDPDGDATVLFKAGNKAGVATITASYNAHERDKIETLTKQTTVTIRDEDKPTAETWSLTITQNDDVVVDGRVISTRRETVTGTFVVDFPNEFQGRAPLSGSGTGTATYTHSEYTWYGISGPCGSYAGTCPGASKTQSASYTISGDVVDHASIRLSVGTETEGTVYDYYTCTSDNRYKPTCEEKYAFYLNSAVFNSSFLDYKDQVWVVTDEPQTNSLYQWELTRLQ